MKIVPYTKNTEFRPMTSMMNLFDTFFNRYMDEEMEADTKAMAMDIVERDDEYELVGNLPGFKKEDVKISVHDRELVIEAKYDTKKEEKKGTLYRAERYTGNYRRSLYLPENADPAKIQAKMEDGVLKLTIPKKAESAKKEITID